MEDVLQLLLPHRALSFGRLPSIRRLEQRGRRGKIEISRSVGPDLSQDVRRDWSNNLPFVATRFRIIALPNQERRFHPSKTRDVLGSCLFALSVDTIILVAVCFPQQALPLPRCCSSRLTNSDEPKGSLPFLPPPIPAVSSTPARRQCIRGPTNMHLAHVGTWVYEPKCSP